jgi:hypothetical protein
MSLRPKRFRISRDGVLFLAGLLGVLHETAFVDQERPTLLLLFAAMMGLPAFLRADEARKQLETSGTDKSTSEK